MLSRLSRRTKIFLLVASVLALAVNQPARVQADTNPINLVLGGAGATSWNISSIKPGDNGTATVTLHNAGTIDGFVTIWLSNLVSIEGPAGRPGKFADYLLLDVSVPGLETNLHLPVVISGFPQSTSDSNYVRVGLLPAGATTTLVWKWELPPQTGNNIQGNGVSFSINYTLEQLHTPEPSTQPVISTEPDPEPSPEPTPAVPAPPLRTLGVIVEGSKINTVEIGADGTLPRPLEITDSKGNFILDVGSGTRITGPNDAALDRIELTVVNEPFPVSENMFVLSPVYKITGYTRDNQVVQVIFDPFAVININYDRNRLPANALTPYTATYSDGQGVVRLEPLPGSLVEASNVKGLAFHASLFAAVTELAPPPPPLPASFRLDNLLINPVESKPGQPVSIGVDIANDGAAQGSYQLYLVIDGIVREIKDVTMEPGSVVTVMFEVANLAPGNHQVKIAGLTGEFRIVSVAASPHESPVNWILTDLSVVMVLLAGALISYLVVRRSQKQSRL